MSLHTIQFEWESEDDCQVADIHKVVYNFLMKSAVMCVRRA